MAAVPAMGTQVSRCASMMLRMRSRSSIDKRALPAQSDRRLRLRSIWSSSQYHPMARPLTVAKSTGNHIALYDAVQQVATLMPGRSIARMCESGMCHGGGVSVQAQGGRQPSAARLDGLAAD